MPFGDASPGHVLGRTVPAVPENVAPLRHAVVEVAREAGIDGDRCSEVALAVGEACANVVVHAYRDGRPGPIILEAAIEDHTLRVLVADRGRGIVPRPDSPGLGLGLPLISRLADHVEIQDSHNGDGSRVVMEFALDRERHGALN